MPQLTVHFPVSPLAICRSKLHQLRRVAHTLCSRLKQSANKSSQVLLLQFTFITGCHRLLSQRREASRKRPSPGQVHHIFRKATTANRHENGRIKHPTRPTRRHRLPGLPTLRLNSPTSPILARSPYPWCTAEVEANPAKMATAARFVPRRAAETAVLLIMGRRSTLL